MIARSTLDKSDKIWEFISILILLVQATFIFFSLQALPDMIAIHFTAEGQPDGWASKHTLWYSLAGSILFYLLFTLISFRPGFYRWRMTEKNLEEQYKLTAKMARTLKAFIMLALFTITIFMVQTADGKSEDQIPYPFLIMFALILLPCFYYVVRFSKIM